jgi:hypothetical protein
VTVAGDITQQADIDRIVGTAGSRIDGLANVAGVNDDFSPAHETSATTRSTSTARFCPPMAAGQFSSRRWQVCLLGHQRPR